MYLSIIMQIMTRLARLKLSLSCATSWKKSNLRRIQKLFFFGGGGGF